MVDADEEKYEKARRQRGRKCYCMLVTFLLVTALLYVITAVWNDNDDHDRSKTLRSGSLQTTLKRDAADAVAAADGHLYQVDISSLVEKVNKLDAEVRRIKKTGVIMETDSASLEATGKLQDATRELLHARYGTQEPYRVKVVLEFQEQSPEFREKGPNGEIIIEMAPSRLQPHSVFSFLEVARQYEGGAFHRIARHVLQVMVRGRFPPLAFQEYSKEYPHKKGTVGYAGRPSGPAWYVSIQDNSMNHGPGSQQKHNPFEADSCFGKVIAGYDNEVQRIAKIPEKGFLNDKKKHVLIKNMIILVPGTGSNAIDGYVEWKEKTLSSAKMGI